MIDLDIHTLLAAYADGSLSPADVVNAVADRTGGDDPHNVWIHRLAREQMLAYAERLEGHSPADLPLYGIPFAIKDNIDLAGVPTTAGCPGYAYTPERSAFVVQRLIDAGAIPVGKTNLDQFATGLVGARSPYGPGRNAFDPEYISGGSSSGSAIAIATGQVSFALGTDTAGSGRVPAAFNNLVGLKPSKGLLSTSGVVPACRSLDCVSVFALTGADAARVLEAAAAFDPGDPFARPLPRRDGHFIPAEGFRFGVPHREQLAFFGNEAYAALFDAAVARLEAMGGIAVPVDLAPFLEAARLLYEGPWVAERYAAVGEFLERAPEAVLPVTRGIIARGREATAVETFRGSYRLAELKRIADRVWGQVDCVVTPTAGSVYRIAEVEADPLRLNANLGYYTNFMNLLDYAAVAAPAGFTGTGLPFGITLFAPAFADRELLATADRFHRGQELALGALDRPLTRTPAFQPAGGDEAGAIPLVVCGAHMAGLALNHQLRDRGARLLRRTRSAACYRFYALAGPVPRPGLVRGSEGGAIEVEVWALPREQWGSFVAGIPAPLGIGKVELADGSWLPGFIAEPAGCAGAEEITALGGWRAWLRTLT